MAKVTKRVVKKKGPSKIVVAAVVLAIVAVYMAYASVSSAEISSTYVSSVQSDAMKLKPRFKALEASAAAKSFDSPDAPILQYSKDLANAERRAKELRTSVNDFELKYKDHASAPFTSFLPLYTESNKISKDVRYMAAQTNSVLNEYQELITSLRSVNKLELSLESGLNEVNAVTNFNTLVFQGSIYRTKAAMLRTNVEEVRSLGVPAEYLDYTNGILARAESFAASLDRLANGLDISADSVIYGATAEIETLSNEYFSVDKQRRFDANQKSLILKQVGEITEKLDAFDPSESSD